MDPIPAQPSISEEGKVCVPGTASGDVAPNCHYAPKTETWGEKTPKLINLTAPGARAHREDPGAASTAAARARAESDPGTRRSDAGVGEGVANLVLSIPDGFQPGTKLHVPHDRPAALPE